MKKSLLIFLPLTLIGLSACGGGNSDNASSASQAAPLESAPVIVAPSIALPPAQATLDNSTAPSGPPIGTYARPKDIIVTATRDATFGVSKVADTLADDQDVGWFTRYGPTTCLNNVPCWGQANIGYNGHMWWTYNKALTPNSATWQPYLDCPGNYQVSAYIPGNNATTLQAPYTIQHASGSSPKTVPQLSYSNQWAALGSFKFNKTGGSVTLSDKTGETAGTKKVGYDAMKWTWESASASLTVTSPNGGETWTKGSSGCVNVTWNSSGLSDNVRIHLYKGGSFYKTLTNNTSNSGSYCVPKTDFSSVTSGNDYTIGMSNVSSSCDGTVYDFSNGNFTITAPANPNLKPYYHPTWGIPLIGSTSSLPNQSSSALIACQNSYFRVSWENNGGSDAGSHSVGIYIDGNYQNKVNVSGQQSGYYTTSGDIIIGPQSAGTHTVQMVVDDGNAVSESNESDNTFSKSFTWNGCAPTTTIATNNGNSFQTTNYETAIQGTCTAASGDAIAKVVLSNNATGKSYTISNSTNWSFGGISLNVGDNGITATCYGQSGATGSDSIVVTRIAPPQTGIISGSITSGGSSLGGGVTIVAIGPVTKVAGSDSNGNYTMPDMQPGTYDVKASKPGYLDQVKTVSVSAGNTTVVSFSLTKIPAAGFYYSPNNIGVTMNSGALNSSQTFIVKNTGDAQLDYTPSANVNWASVQKNGASVTGKTLSLAPGAQDVLTVTFNSNSITSSQSGAIAFSHNDPTQGSQSLFLGMGINAPPPQPPPPAEQPAPSTPAFQPALYGQCQMQNACYADPVNTAIGNYLYYHTDLAVSSRGPDLVFTRHYNSLDATLGPLGLGWTHSFNSQIITAGNGDAYIRWGTGRVDRYTWNGNGFTPPAGITATLIKGNYYVLSEADQTTWTFTGEGQLQTIADRHNNKLQLYYDSQKRLVTATNALGESLTFAYLSSTDSKLASVTDFTGRKVQFAYSGNLLTQVTDVLGKPFAFAYDSGGRLSQLTERDGKVLVANSYDANGRVTQQTDALNAVTTFAYNTPSPGQTTVTDPSGFKHVYAYDALYRLITHTAPTGDKVSYLYNTFNLPVEITDAKGSKTISTYDSKGNLTSVTDASGAKWLWTYDTLNRITNHTTPLGQSYAYTYDTNGNLSQVATTVSGNVTSVTYNYLATGETTSITDPMGLTTQYTYTTKGELKSSTNANAETTQFAVDTLHRPTAITDPLLRTWTYAYDANDNLQSATTPLGQKSTYTYTPRGQLADEIHPEGKLSRGYDAAGQLTSLATPEGTTAYTYNALRQLVATTNPAGQKKSFGYNSLGYLTSITDPTGTSASFTYDPMGNLLSSTDSAGQKTSYTVDGLGRTTQVQNPVGSTASFAYNAMGQVIQATDPAGSTYTTTYDELGRKTQLTNPTNRSIVPQYDKNSRITQLTTPRGTIYTWTYDKIGRILSQTSPGGTKSSFTFDAAGQLTSITDASNKKTSIGYDADGKPTQISFADGVSRTINYDSANRPTQIALGAATRSYTYDAAGRITGTTDSWGKTVSYAYTADGSLAAITYPGNKTVTYGYDAAGRLTSVKDWLGGTTIYTYDTAGRLQQSSYPNGVKTTRSYDADSRVISLTHKKSDASLIMSQTMTYDSRGNVTSIDTNPEPNGWIKSKFTQYEVNADDQYTAIDGWLSLGYDPVGQMLSKDVDGSEPTKYTFDVRGRLTAAIVAGTSTSFAYGPEGERIEKTSATQTTRYVVDTNTPLSRVIMELDANSAPSTYYIYGLGLIARVPATGNAIQYYHEDIQRNIVALTNASGAITDTYFYHPFGKVLAKTGTTPNPFQFAGQLGVEQDETGLLYMRARYYDPALERFISKDPIGISAGDLNLYAYVHNNPTGYTDPSGLFLDVIADIGFIAYDLWNLVTDPSWDNAAALALDTGAAFVPFATGAGAVYKTGKAAVTAEKITSKADNIASSAVKSTKPGKLGNTATKDHVSKLAEDLQKSGHEVVGGGGIAKETYIPGPGGGTKGSAYPDITVKKDGKVTHINTVDTYADNLTPTTRETNNLNKIKKLDPTSNVVQIPKPKPTKDFPGGNLPKEMLSPPQTSMPTLTGIGAGYIATKNYFESTSSTEQQGGASK